MNETTTTSVETLDITVILVGDYYTMQVHVAVPIPAEVLSKKDIDDDDEHDEIFVAGYRAWWKESALALAIENIKSYYGWDIEGTIIDVDFETA